MVLKRRSLILSSVSAAVLTCVPISGVALAMDARQVVHRILAADKLSMYAESIAKSVVLIRLGVDVDEYLAEMQEAHDDFDNILVGFETGGGTSGVKKERFVSVKNALKHVEQYWGPYRTAVEEIIADKKVDDAHLDAIVLHDEELEEACHDVVRKIEDAYSKTDIDLGLALAVDFAGRQRMLTQKVCKEIALAATGTHIEEHHEKFTKNAVKFGKIIDFLIAGGNGAITIAPPPNEAVMAGLQELKSQWDVTAPEVDKLNASDVPAVADVAAFCRQMDSVADTAEHVAHLYEEATGPKV